MARHSDEVAPLALPQLVDQLRTLGVRSGGVLLVHASFRAVRPVQGGPFGLIAALRRSVGPSGTLVMPSWPGDDDQPFHSGLPAAPDLGGIAELFRRTPGVLRSDHSQSFCAVGPLAPTILADPLPLPPHGPESPVGRVHDHDGQILLLGVDHQVNTTLHLAEVLAGVPYGLPAHCTVVRNGLPVRLEYRENDHCCQRFQFADEWLRAARLQSGGLVGRARSRLFRSRDLVRLVRQRLALDPLLFLHPESASCFDCNEARASIKRTGS